MNLSRTKVLRRHCLPGLLLLSGLCWLVPTAWAAAGPERGGANHALDPVVLIGLAVVLIVAKLGGEVFERLGGLAAIVGAFAAGLLLDEAHFEHLPDHTKHDLTELLTPVSQLLVPVFFVLMGLRVDLRDFARMDILGFAVVLTLAGIAGKQICSLAVAERGLNRLAVGLGMIPRGEVGLIFAGIGATLTLPNAQGVGEPVIGPATFGAVVIMVIVTTMITPPALKWSITRGGSSGPPHDPLPSAQKTTDEAAELTTR